MKKTVATVSIAGAAIAPAALAACATPGPGDGLFGINVETAVQESSARLSVRDDQALRNLIGRPGPYPVEPEVRACSGKFTTTENVVSRFSDRGMDPASTIGPKVRNFFSNEDTGKQACFELAPGFFIAAVRKAPAAAAANYGGSGDGPPKTAEAFLDWGLAYHHKGLYDRAIEDYSAALRIDPDYAAAYYNRGNAYRGKGMPDRAIADYSAALRIDPNFADAYTNRGVAYGIKGLYDRAIADYTAALRIDPNLAAAKANLELARKARRH
jgi:tetratricopeptide (TPR) repeat protein